MNASEMFNRYRDYNQEEYITRLFPYWYSRTWNLEKKEYERQKLFNRLVREQKNRKEIEK